MPRTYSPADWFWIVGDGPSNQVYASRRFGYFANTDAEYLAFVADGNFATSIALEADLRDVLNAADVRFLAEPLPALAELRPRVVLARCRLQIATFAVPNATGTAVPWDTELVDPVGMHAASNPDRIVIPESGWYLALGGVRWLESSAGAGGTPNTGMRAAQLRIGPATVVATARHAPSPADNTEFPVTDYFQAAAGDILRMFVEQRCGGAMNAAARITVGRVE